MIERGAVEGELFHRGAVRQLTNGSADGVDVQLTGLVRKELIRPDRSTFPGDDAYRFRHLLIRDAAYDALPKETRADLHLRFADWLEAHPELVELDEIVGYHLEQAARYARELGHADSDVERRAAARLGSAGTKAASREDFPAANNLLGRALDLLPREDEARPLLVLERILVLEHIGGFDARTEPIDELEAHPDPRVRLNGRIARSLMLIFADPREAIPVAQAVAKEALEQFEAVGDDFGMARAWLLLFHVHWLGSRSLPALAALERVREHAARANARQLLTQTNVFVMGPLLHGPLTPDEVRARVEPLRSGGAIAANTVLRVEAHLLDLEGRFDEALQKHAEANAITDQLGLTIARTVTLAWQGEIMLRQGRGPEAVALMRETVARLEALGDKSFRSTCLVRLADALYEVGEPEEAEQRAIEGEALGATEDVVNYAYGRSVRARIAADRGELAAGEQFARDAITYAYATDFPWVHAIAHKALARVLAAAGRVDEARSELERATELFESFGNVYEAERTRRLLVEL